MKKHSTEAGRKVGHAGKGSCELQYCTWQDNTKSCAKGRPWFCEVPMLFANSSFAWTFLSNMYQCLHFLVLIDDHVLHVRKRCSRGQGTQPLRDWSHTFPMLLYGTFMLAVWHCFWKVQKSAKCNLDIILLALRTVKICRLAELALCQIRHPKQPQKANPTVRVNGPFNACVWVQSAGSGNEVDLVCQVAWWVEKWS